eukprot:c34398_g1_i1 orf=87-326(+)
MGTGGRPLFDLNELPPIQDDCDFPDNPQISSQPVTSQLPLPSIGASQAQLSPDLGTSPQVPPSTSAKDRWSPDARLSAE